MQRIPPHLLVVTSGLVQYIGSAVAVIVFDLVAPASVAWWRVFVGALVLLAWRRPWRDGLTRQDLAHSALFGVVLVLMNVCFYESIARLPMGPAVSVEFLGPVTVAMVRGRGPAPRIAALLALAGVTCIGGLSFDLSDPGQLTGLAWILGAAAAWGTYIVLGQRIASKRSGVTNLALGCAAGALVFAPALGPGAMAALSTWWVLAAVVGVALLSTVVPYSLEAVAMARVPASTFALLTALLPATSTLSGAVVLGQVPSIWDLVGMPLVSVAVWIVSRKPSEGGQNPEVS
ncbi:EamA family transporter [Schaalia sp. 19OD2882]|uniref:EamA family transporter n=1 Tax=Schaalia sp. 19OD2882 TaxID=2794089 RepID=UPI001C1F18BE|nr:EamA family transporter [Schaalia sp. 19OD2882]QWW19398.1 EamA family transporter [Schaalia sp. 19OD2882]